MVHRRIWRTDEAEGLVANLYIVNPCNFFGEHKMGQSPLKGDYKTRDVPTRDSKSDW
jgi:hypothetical protein